MVTSKISKSSIFFILFFLSSSISWGMMDDKINEEKGKQTKITILNSVLGIINKNAYSFFKISKYSSIDENPSIFVYSGLEILPKVVIKYISNYLDPLSIIKLSHANKNFRKIFDNNFWINYNFINNYQTFSEKRSCFSILNFTREALPIKVMIANYYYEIGVKTNKQKLIEKSSLLGLQKAKNYLEKENNKNISNFNCQGSNYYGYYNGDVDFVCEYCGEPIQYCTCY